MLIISNKSGAKRCSVGMRKFLSLTAVFLCKGGFGMLLAIPPPVFLTLCRNAKNAIVVIGPTTCPKETKINVRNAVES